jgi:hypothetical protein
MRASVIFPPHFVHGASIRRSRNKVGTGGEAGMDALQTKWGTEMYMLVEIEELIWVNVSALNRLERGWPVVVPSVSFQGILKMLGSRVMFLPAQYAWFEPVLIATIVVFIIDLVGNSIGFGNRFLSALMSAIVFALVFGTLVYFGYGSVSMSVTTTPSTTAPAQTQK